MPRLSKIGAAALAAFGWTSGDSAVTASYLVVAGGGAGGISGNGGGGGAGGLLASTTSLSLALSYTVTVGAGGTSVATNFSTNGNNSVFNAITAIGGGAGAPFIYTGTGVGNSGGSGGGGLNDSTNYAGGAGTSGQGNAGGASGGGGAPYPGGGGGGAGAVGTVGTSGGQGGIGSTSSITGSSTYYAGGGGGARSSGSASAGGLGGGGNGGVASAGIAGTANLGGGGGGSGGGAGGFGGSGVVIISYPSPQKFGGGIVTTDGTNTIHTFQTSGTLSPLSSLSASYLVVAGGGGGGGRIAGGGGAGGLLTGSGVTIDTNSIYVVTVGSGGNGGTNTGGSGTRGTSGSNSVFLAATSTGGGGGGNYGSNDAGLTGGSGGGGSGNNGAGGSGTSGQGNAGGTGSILGNISEGGGGGGASAAGSDGQASGSGRGNGGAGTASSISGSSVTYAGGGGGGAYFTAAVAGDGGSGGGGAGSIDAGATGGTGTGTPANGTANLGGGGGGNGVNASGAGGNGGSGIVIISYAGSVQQMAGGTVTISGGNVIHTFTSSGYLTPLKLVNNSLRFRQSVTTYLTRTLTVNSTSQTTMTWSAWVKRGILGAASRQIIAYCGNTAGSGNMILIEWYNDTIRVLFDGGATTALITSQVFRDPAAWYHIVVAYDSTQATSSNRAKLYINGSQVTAFSTASYPASSQAVNNVAGTVFNYGNVGGVVLDGYVADTYWIDGQALTPNSFGTFNSYGVWQPITYGGSYGTNGFYLPFNQGGSTYYAPFNGTTQLISAPANAAFNFTGNFTAECFVNTSTITNASQPTLFTIGTDSAGLVVGFYSGAFYCYMLGSGGLMSAATLPLNQWVHVAWVRVSGVNTLYLNGVASATASVSGTLSSTGGVTVGKTGSSGSAFNFFQGSVSNFRVNNTALYTANFIPPTSALTAVSGTQLLTLQSATIIDNSTNAFTITNTGSVTTAVSTTPVFVNRTTLAADQGPSGNNFTAVNTSVTTGSTYDSMTDVPTLTSATVANYCVLNPLDKYSTVVLSSGNLNCSYSGAAWLTMRSTIAFPTTGKWYVEGTVISLSGGSMIGIGTAAATLANYAGADAFGWSYNSGGQKFNSASGPAYGATFTIGDIIAVAFDADAGTLTFYKNNTSQGVAYSGLSSGPYFLMPSVNVSEWAINFGQQPFTYTPPTNFVALNTFNL
jgi:hypothetical protein